MDHPFHFHVNHAQVLSINGGDSAYAVLYTTAPAWKDTIIVPKMGKITILVSIQDYTGMTMFHCHIVEHDLCEHRPDVHKHIIEMLYLRLQVLACAEAQ